MKQEEFNEAGARPSSLIPVHRKFRSAAMAAALAATATAAPGTQEGPRRPIWPDNGIAERQLGDGDLNYPQSMFAEYVDGKWTVWVIMAPVNGQAKALDFFSGEIVLATVNTDYGVIDSFVDEKGVAHEDNVFLSLMDARPGGGLGGIDFRGVSAPYIEFGAGTACGPVDLTVVRGKEDDGTIRWRKLPLYKSGEHPLCPEGVWESFINTALDLGDGTMLITGGKYVFRVRQKDLSPVGSAPHLHIVEEVALRRAISEAAGEKVENVTRYLDRKLGIK